LASFTERIKIVVDVVTDGAKTGLSGFKSAVADAEGTTNKFKAGAGAAFDSIKANAGALAVGAGSALVAYGIKAADVFVETAKHAEDMAAATGLSIDQASRWIAVADDLGVSAESLQGAIGKVVKGLDKKVWEDYGIATHDAAGHLKDTNDIMLDAFDKLSNIPAGTARAKAGTDLFGKSYAALAPLIGKSRSEMEKYLGAVEKGQVITAAEAKTGKDMRLAMDDLHDSLQEVTLAVGGMVAEAAPFVEAAAHMVTATVGLSDTINEKFGTQKGSGAPFEGFFGSVISQLAGAKGAWDNLVESVEKMTDPGKADRITKQGEAISETERETRKLATTTGDAAATDQALADSADAAKRASKMMTDSIERGLQRDKAAMEELKGSVDDHQAWIALEQEFDSVKQSGVDAADAVAKHQDDAREKLLTYASDVDGLKLKVIDYASEVLKLPTDRVTKIVAEVNPQSLAEVEALLAALTRNRDVNISIIAKGGAGYGTLTGGPRAAGGPVAAGQVYTVGEKGPETFVPSTNGTILPNGAGGPTTIINHWPPGISPVRVAQATREYTRRGGRL